MLLISGDEQPGYRAKSWLSKGLRRRRARTLLQLLPDHRHRWRRSASSSLRRRPQRGPRDFCHGLLRYTAASIARRNARKVSAAIAVCALVAAAGVVTLSGSRKAASSPPGSRSVAMLPFRNTDTDHHLDFLPPALGSEIATPLSYARSLSARPLEANRNYAGAGQGPLQAARHLYVTDIVTGHFQRVGEQLQLVLEATDVETKRILWRDVFDVPVR